ALENVVVGTPGASVKEAKSLLEALGIGEKSHRQPHELSGGERQRVCVARALLGGRRAIFADEPTAALDHKNGLQVVNLLQEFRKNGSLVMVTHDPSMLAGADRIVRIEDGRLVKADEATQTLELDGPVGTEAS
ncbi:MAG: ATP-binding cassette domain-containing protein, partial [Fimbriimonadaceae bacterium]|nr:ATP-binding cassette domain-containing protein [Fimbriimonadaceae bacterium]